MSSQPRPARPAGTGHRNPAGRHRAAGPRPELYQLVYTNFMIGLDHRGPGISTDSARGPETTGNNRDDSGKPDTRRGYPTPPQGGLPPTQRLGKTAGQPYQTSNPVTARPMIIR
jgi:hypothetical protein